MRGILSWSAYLPYRRLDRTQIAPFVGQGGGKGTRTVASFDEDSTTMAVEAARLALRGRDLTPAQLLFATSFPAYADKHERERHPRCVAAPRTGARVRSRRVGARRRRRLAARPVTGSADAALVVAADVRTGLPGSGEEAAGGDAAAAFVVGDDTAGPVVAEFLGSASVTEEFVERWRAPGEHRTRVWDEKFSEITYVPLGVQAWNAALESAGLTAGDVAAAAVVAPAQRVARSVGGKLDGVHVIDDLSADRRQHRGRAAGPAPRRRCSNRPSPGRCSRWSCWPTVPTCCSSVPRRRWARTDRPGPVATQVGGGRPAAVRQVPRLAGHVAGGATASARAAAGLGDGRGAQRGMEVRVRRFEGA